MSLRWFFVIFLLLVLIVGYLAYLNPAVIDIHIPFFDTFRLSAGLLMILSFVLGLFIVLFLVTIRDWREYFHRLAEEKRLRLAQEARRSLLKSSRLRELGFTEPARTSLEEALEKDPGSPDIHEAMGDQLAEEGNFSEAVVSHLKALELDRENDLLYWKLALDYLRDGNENMAARTLHERIDIKGRNPYLLSKYRQILMEEGNWDEAIRIHSRLARLKEYKNSEDNQPFLAGLYYEKAKSLLADDQPTEALKALEMATKIDPQLSDAYILTGEAQIALGKEKVAQKNWALGYRRCRDLTILKRLEKYYLKKNDPSRIINLYLKYIDENPEDAGLRLQLAKLLYKLEMLEEARSQVEAINRIQEREPVEAALLSYRISRKIGDDKNVMDELAYMVENFPPSGEGYQCLHCRVKVQERVDRCPECLRWGSLRQTF